MPRSASTGPTIEPSRASRASSLSGRSRARRSAILRAAVDLFSATPYEDVSLDDVCEQAGVAHGLVSYYFGGKRGLFVAAVEQVWQDLVDYEVATDESATPEDRIREFLSRHFEYAGAHPGHLSLMQAGHLDPTLMATVRTTREKALHELASALGCPPEMDPMLRAAINGWVGYVDNVTLDWLTTSDVELERISAMCLDVLVVSVRHARGMASTSTDSDVLAHVTGHSRTADRCPKQ